MAGRGTKKCSVGGETRPLSEFNKRKLSADGYRSECKYHQALARKKHYKKTGE